MKRILIVLEASAYDFIAEINPPNINKLNPHPAVSFGLGSRPATAALLGGLLPVCQIPNCYHRDIAKTWANPFFLSSVKEQTKRQFYLCPNGWSLEILLPWMVPEEVKLNFYWHDNHELLPAKLQTDYFLENVDKYESYFAYIHFFECHHPFYSPEGTGDRKASFLWCDEQVGRIVDHCKDAEIVVCSDHNIPPGRVSAATDVPSPVTMLSFFASNITKPIPWKVNPHEIAKRMWIR